MGEYIKKDRRTIVNYETNKSPIPVAVFDKLNGVYPAAEDYIRGQVKTLLGEIESNLNTLRKDIQDKAKEVISGD